MPRRKSELGLRSRRAKLLRQVKRMTAKEREQEQEQRFSNKSKGNTVERPSSSQTSGTSDILILSIYTVSLLYAPKEGGYLEVLKKGSRPPTAVGIAEGRKRARERRERIRGREK